MSEVVYDLPFQAAQFISACEDVKDLPFQNGDEEWAIFQSMLKQLNEKNINIGLFVAYRVSDQLAKSPLFEILFGAAPTIKPPATMSTVKSRSPFTRRRKIKLDFTAKDFIALCMETDYKYSIELDNPKFHISHFKSMTNALVQEQVNILEFLSYEMTDELLDECPFFGLILHTARAERSHVFVDWVALYNALDTRQGLTLDSHRVHVPPYPPSQYGLTFDHEQFVQSLKAAEADMQGMQAAEANMDELTTIQYDNFESFDILHGWWHQLSDKHVSIFVFMADREPADGTSGSIIYKYLIDAVTPPEHPHPGEVDCFRFFANVASKGNGEALIASIENDLLPKTPPGLLTHEQANAFADALLKVDVAAIPRDSIRCMHCWANFDEVEDGVNNEPLQLPCDSRHMLGRDCLVEVLTSISPLCPLCRVDMVAMVSDVD